MRVITATIVLVAGCVLLDEKSFAQKPEVPLKPRIGINPSSPGVFVWPDSLKRLKGLPDSLTSDNLSLRTDSIPFLADAYGSAFEAAEVDPGILIFPDPSVDAKILRIEPPENVDPKMIIPRE